MYRCNPLKGMDDFDCCDFGGLPGRSWKIVQARQPRIKSVCDLCREEWDCRERYRDAREWYRVWLLVRAVRDDKGASPLVRLLPLLPARRIAQMLVEPRLPPLRCGHMSWAACHERALTKGLWMVPGSRQMVQHLRSDPGRYGGVSDELVEFVRRELPPRPEPAPVPVLLARRADEADVVMDLLGGVRNLTTEQFQIFKQELYTMMGTQLVRTFKRRRTE
jgi:hypothetical protein